MNVTATNVTTNITASNAVNTDLWKKFVNTHESKRCTINCCPCHILESWAYEKLYFALVSGTGIDDFKKWVDTSISVVLSSLRSFSDYYLMGDRRLLAVKFRHLDVFKGYYDQHLFVRGDKLITDRCITKINFITSGLFQCYLKNIAKTWTHEMLYQRPPKTENDWREYLEKFSLLRSKKEYSYFHHTSIFVDTRSEAKEAADMLRLNAVNLASGSPKMSLKILECIKTKTDYFLENVRTKKVKNLETVEPEYLTCIRVVNYDFF